EDPRLQQEPPAEPRKDAGRRRVTQGREERAPGGHRVKNPPPGPWGRSGSVLVDAGAPVPGEGRRRGRRIDVEDADVADAARLGVSALVQDVVAEGQQKPGLPMGLLDARTVRSRDLVEVEPTLDVALVLAGPNLSLDLSGAKLLAIDREGGVPGQTFHRPVLLAHV